VDATVPSHHYLVDVTGNATHLGRFSLTAEWTLAATGGSGTSKWTAANGDEFSTSFTRSRVVAPPIVTFTEIHTITSGTGRFASASGSFTVVQIRGLSAPYNNSATIDGTMNFGH
jgi:hypothetical protein